MKKLFVMAALFTALVTTASAQGGGQGGMTPEQRAERQKQVKTELVAKAKITEAEADKVMQIQADSRAGLRGLRDMSQEDRQKKMDEVKAENTKKFKAIPLTDDQVKAVDAFYDEQIKKMMNRGGGNGGNGNGNGNGNN
jgi:ribosomal protein L29